MIGSPLENWQPSQVAQLIALEPTAITFLPMGIWRKPRLWYLIAMFNISAAAAVKGCRRRQYLS
jgi:hypothetical protein